MSKCSKCRIAVYCSKECQTKHWINHKHLCSDISAFCNDHQCN
jgi:hypothetical protein